MGAWASYRLRLQRKRWRIRAFRKRRELAPVADRTAKISHNDVLVFSTLRNERIRLPYFLEYYRRLGISHFLVLPQFVWRNYPELGTFGRDSRDFKKALVARERRLGSRR